MDLINDPFTDRVRTALRAHRRVKEVEGHLSRANVALDFAVRNLTLAERSFYMKHIGVEPMDARPGRAGRKKPQQEIAV